MKPTAIQKALSPPPSSSLPLGERRAVERRKRDKGPDLGKRCKRRRRRRRRRWSKTPFPDIRPFVHQSRVQFMSFTSGLFGGARIVCTFIGSLGQGKSNFGSPFLKKLLCQSSCHWQWCKALFLQKKKCSFFPASFTAALFLGPASEQHFSFLFQHIAFPFFHSGYIESKNYLYSFI